MNEFFQQFVQNIVSYLPSALAAIGVLIGGWLVALIVAAIVRGALRRTRLDERIARLISDDKDAPEQLNIAHWASRVVYYLIMLFVLVGFLQTLNLAVVAQPINELLNQVLSYIPILLGGAALLFVAWLVASALKFFVLRVLKAIKFDERVAIQAKIDTQETSFSSSIANVVYWLIFLLFLPAVLGALGLQGLLEPVQGIVDEILGVLPNILGAGLILFVGWLGARILRQILTNVLAEIGTDRLGERTGFSAALGGQKLSYILGTVVYVLVLIPILISALNTLQIEAVSRPASEMLTILLTALPAIFGAMLLIVVAYMVARFVSNFVTNVLSGVGFDKVLTYIGLGDVAGETTPSQIIGYLTTIAIMLFAIIEAANLLGFNILAVLISEFIVAAGGVLLAVLIFGLGLYLAGLVDRVIRDAGVKYASVLAPAARIAIIVFSGALALRETGIAQDIVTMTFTIVLGTIGVAAALAFGLGSREIAAKELENWITSWRKR
ncbi:MAG: mechanosensitive ion channel [Anaerolineales bacterium]|jgi:hypothetical protein|nr:mechanosensitive ion channel [Anaerolineales bacterium]